ncbi:MAG: undecaprenyldiphospho-muramoylpentapeptide beta-N-acetylglucosaminyltransferase [Proteobacteria bacterium]|nr:undecaprenyldiphospho-muramoylpentapeptide beta-N-acetylglucosaminyltransferase [Pseudomonadota bacterium]
MAAEIDTLRVNPIILVAGGTGGHVFPAQALASELKGRDCTLALFTDRRGGTWSNELKGVDYHHIRAGQVTTGSLIARARGGLASFFGLLKARRLLRELKPNIVVGFGSYASVPAMIAATRLGIPTVIHEQNALLGRANRILAPHVSAIATSFPEVAGIEPEDQDKVRLTGNPVRQSIRALAEKPYPPLTASGPIHLLVLGGSQGATVFSEVIPEALSRLTKEMRARLKVSQQCRPEDIDKVRDTYDRLRLKAELATFFDDVPERISQAHCVISRSGASTTAELTVAGRPAILVPYPHATGDHQTLNARAIEAAGAALVMPESNFTAQTLSARLKLLLSYPIDLGRMAERASRIGRVNAAATLADLVIAMCPINGRETPAPNPGRSGREAAA